MTMTFTLRRAMLSAAVIVTVAFVAFAASRLLGDPVDHLLDQQASVAERARLIADLGLDQPLLYQFWRYIQGAACLDFGQSYHQGRPVLTIIAERVPASIELAALAMLVSLVIGIPAGILAAARPRSLLGRLITAVALLGVSLPTFLLGVLLIWIFSVEFAWLPAFGRGETVDLGWWQTGLLTRDGLQSLVLPVTALAVYQLTYVVRLVRIEILKALNANYVTYAVARGLPWHVILFRHAGANAAGALISMLSLQFGHLITFAIITETVFQWPGLGLLLITSINHVDTPVLGAYLMLVATIFVVINLIADAALRVVDPRVRDAHVGNRVT